MKSVLITYLVSIMLLSTGQMQAQQASENPKVKTGIEVLREMNFSSLQGKRVGLITNPTGVNHELKSTVDILHEAGEVNLVALYGPEHGVRGNFDAGTKVEDMKDPVTGLPVYSLYGKNRKPSDQMLEGVDVLVFDIQDIGSRSYTYISTLGLVMEAAAANDKKVVVLDRPNPLGGNLVAGTLWESDFKSFVSQFDIPYLHGLTVGELAAMLNDEKLLKDGVQCELEVIAMQGWKRNMVFEDTGLPWVPTSPHIPHAYTPFYYAATGIVGELNGNFIGVGYTLPFQVLATPWMNAEKLAKAMNGFGFEGVRFKPVYFRPYYKKYKGKEMKGVQIYITDFHKVKPTRIQFAFLNFMMREYPGHNLFEAHPERHTMFDWVCGSDKIRKIFDAEDPDFEKFKQLWYGGVDEFKKLAAQYYLYE